MCACTYSDKKQIPGEHHGVSILAGHDGSQSSRKQVRTVLDGLCGDLVVGVLVVLGLDLDDDVVALCEPGVAAGLEAVAAGSASVGRVEGRALAALVLGRANERLKGRHVCGGGFGGGRRERSGGEAAHGGGYLCRDREGACAYDVKGRRGALRSKGIMSELGVQVRTGCDRETKGRETEPGGLRGEHGEERGREGNVTGRNDLRPSHLLSSPPRPAQLWPSQPPSFPTASLSEQNVPTVALIQCPRLPSRPQRRSHNPPMLRQRALRNAEGSTWKMLEGQKLA